MAVASAFQRNAFQNNAFQVGTLVVVGGSGFSGYVFRRKKWEDMMEDIIEARRKELEELNS